MNNKDKPGLWLLGAVLGLCLLSVAAIIAQHVMVVVLGLILGIGMIQMLFGLQQRVIQLEQQRQWDVPTEGSWQKIVLYGSLLIGLWSYDRLNHGLSLLAFLVFALCVLRLLYQLQCRITQLEAIDDKPQAIIPETSVPTPVSVSSPTSPANRIRPDWMQHEPAKQPPVLPSRDVEIAITPDSSRSAGWQPFWNWLINGNPILRVAVAVLMVGVILLLRFASEHWQLSLGVKLLFIALAGGGVTAFGYYLGRRNALFAVTLQGIGLAVVFLTLVFAYHYAVIGSLGLAAGYFAVLLVLTTSLSLRQDSLSLAILALGMAYLAPLLIPHYHPDALFLWCYYLLINLAVALVSFIKPWKILNHIAFIASMLLGGVIILWHAEEAQKWPLDLVLWLHIALFIGLSVRYSQLLLKQQQRDGIGMIPLLDVGLVFSVPVIGFSLHALLLHDSSRALTTGAAILAMLYGALTFWIRKKQTPLALLGKSFFILAVAFFALIFPLAQGAHWTTIGWVVQGTALLVWGITERYRLSRYIGQMLLLGSSVTLFYQVWNEPEFPVLSCVIYALAQAVAVFYLLCHEYEQPADDSAKVLSSLFLSLGLYAGSAAGVHVLEWQGQGLGPYLAVAMVLFLLFHLFMQWKAAGSWIFTQLWVCSLFWLLGLAEIIHQQLFEQLVWSAPLAQWSFGIAMSLTSLVLIQAQPAEKSGLIVSFEASLLWLTLALAGLAILPENPVIALALLPVLYSIWLFKSRQWMVLQQGSIWFWSSLWLVWANLDMVAATHFYLLPLFNLTDIVTFSVMAGLISMIYRQAFIDRMVEWGIKIGMIVLSLYVLSSIMVRALHHYLQTPLWSWSIWQDGTVQLSLTLLWVLLAFVLMTFSSRQVIRQVWFVGAALLGLVVVKLVLLDLAQSATLTRVFSFIGAGGVMLVIAYLAPLPPVQNAEPKV